MVAEPTWQREIELAALARETLGISRSCVIGVDEVGRGAIAGPVMVGAFAAIIDVRSTGTAELPELPAGIRDSKLLSAKRRENLFETLSSGPWAWHVGSSSAAAIDDEGISKALTLAAAEAVSAVMARIDEPVAGIILDGNLDYLSRGLAEPRPGIEVRIKGDQDCMSVAAASILAKVTRDRRMVALDALAPQYGWASNKGYGSSVHREALQTHGLHPEHRASWNLLPSQAAFDLGL